MTEMLEHRRLREGALRTEEGHLEGLLLRKARRHDLAEQAHDFFVTQRTLIAAHRVAQHLRFTLGPVEIHHLAGGRLGNAHLLGQSRPLVDEPVDTRIDGIDAFADGLQVDAGRHRAGPFARARWCRGNGPLA
jgi:hypothetical protein